MILKYCNSIYAETITGLKMGFHRKIGSCKIRGMHLESTLDGKKIYPFYSMIYIYIHISWKHEIIFT